MLLHSGDTHVCQQNLHKIQRLQNRAAKIVSGKYDYVNTRGIELVKSSQWMNVHQRRDYFMSILMFKCIHGLAPDYLCNEIAMQNEISERTTRSLSILKYTCHMHLLNVLKIILFIGDLFCGTPCQFI